MIQPAKRKTLEEYLELDRGETKHEYLHGEVHAMAGGTPEHSELAANVIRHLGTVLRERPCRVYTSDIRVAIELTGLRTYPDAAVVCGDVRRTDNGNSILNPILLVEVTSPSSADWDRGGKFAHYRRIPSLREYVVVSHEERLVEHHTRGDGGVWTLRDVAGPGVLELVSLGCALPLEEIYLKVVLAPHPRPD
jgi:Uma2 family endonuclease